MSDSMLPCPTCQSPYSYPSDEINYLCSECEHQWNPAETSDSEELIVKDTNGNLLQKGDSVIVIKDLPVKGSLRPVKAGTKVKNIRLSSGDHNIDCKIDGFGSMALKSEFVRKA